MPIRYRIGATNFMAACLLLIICVALVPAIALAERTQPFSIDDYFKIRRVAELSLSSDGAMVAYILESLSLEENETVRNVYVKDATAKTEPVPLDGIPQDARSLAWIPSTHELAYIANHNGVPALYSIDTASNVIRQYTQGNKPTIKFRFTRDGKAVAWITRLDPDHKPMSLYRRMFDGDEGIIIDTQHTIIYEFINPDWPDITERPLSQLWLRKAGRKDLLVDVPGQVKDFYWSSDGAALSITYVAYDMPKKALYNKYSSFGVFDLRTKRFRVLAKAHAPTQSKGAQYYFGGEWVPFENKIFVRRTIERDRWLSSTQWIVVDPFRTQLLESEPLIWREIDIHSQHPEPAFIPVNVTTAYSNKTVHARPSLYIITRSGEKKASILKETSGSISHIQFSTDFETLAFVNQSLTQPPEIFIWNQDRGLIQLTTMNQELSTMLLPKAREVVWKSKDGVTARGWLLQPLNGKEPWPMVTFVHGGPGVPFPDQFAYSFGRMSRGGNWPYPFEVFALNGMAVFIPNYRGTRTFGDEFADPSSLAGEPVDDIISGICHLIQEGVADRSRLAIAGYSHGAWLASLVMVRHNIFQAGSFAEGSFNKIVNYSLMPGWLNRDVHDVKYGTSLYDDPERYIDLSPDLHFKGIDAAVLFEAGAKSLAINMMSAAKAAKRANMSTEFVIYPKTGHGMVLPRLQRESAARNLDWFRFWLLGQEDSVPQERSNNTSVGATCVRG